MDLIESRSLQAKCIVNLMTLVAKDRVSDLKSDDLTQKAYETGCLVGMLEGEIFEQRINHYNVLEDLPFEGEIQRQFISGVTVIIQQLLIDKNRQQLDEDQKRLMAIRDEIQKSTDSTMHLLGNVQNLEKALINSRMFEQDDLMLNDFHNRVETMRVMGHIKDQEQKVLDVLIEQNTQLIQHTDESVQALPPTSKTLNKLVHKKAQQLALEDSSNEETHSTIH